MPYTIFIGIIDEQRLQTGQQVFSGKALEEVKKLFDLSQPKVENIGKCYAYYSKAADNTKKCIELKITAVTNDANSFSISFNVVPEPSNITSEQLKQKAQKILRSEKILATNAYMPFCTILNENQSKKFFNSDTISEKVNELIKNSDWIGIYKMFDPINDLKNKPDLWNDEDLLSHISFATAKLSEVYINLKQNFPNDNDRNKFLTQQKKYREATEFLRQRCLELNPNNPAIHSNIGYSHYQYARELTQQGGRRDGKPVEEIEKSQQYLDNALAINPTRINDLYRKGQMLTELLPKLLLFSRGTRPEASKYKYVNDKIKEGIKAFENGIDTYENFHKEDEFNRKRYYKEYVKCFYDAARAYSDLVANNWDEVLFVLSLDHKINEEDKVTYIPDDLKNIDKSLELIENCCLVDNIPAMSTPETKDIIDIAAHAGVVEGVYKLYSFGKHLFTKYWILSGYGQRTNPKAEECRNKAEEFYKKALIFDWSAEKERADKSFVAEKLCRLYISQKEYEKAAEIIRPFIRRRTDYYIRYTFASALILCGNHKEAKQQLDWAMEYPQSNKEMWLGHFLKACSDLRSNNIVSSKENINKAIKQAEQDGKRNLDSLLIAQGFISIKEDDNKSAAKFFEEALEINPYRVAILKRVPSWKKDDDKLSDEEKNSR
jgi:tetratricopeptide (TPR) repeat protein